ncbi:MAG: carbohydrate ABC transporter permease [Propionibacteriaceae bacterium]|jgi:multiple sugar transport system permease protein|nr:carbohydrate ABC transporter permease [Propionibacteriaceae bacterium]
MSTRPQIPATRALPISGTEEVKINKRPWYRSKDWSPLDATSKFSKYLILFFMTIFAIYTIMPIWWLIVGATKPDGELFSGNGFWFSDFNLWENLQTLFTIQDGVYGYWLLNSLLYAGLGGMCSTLFAVMMGYALAKYKFRGRGVVFAIVLAGVLIPASVFAIPLYLLFSGTGIINTFWSVFIPSMVSPFGVYLSRTYAAESVPDEVIEAGRMDGASEFRIFFQIGLRMMAPALLTIFLFQFVSVWTNYLLPSLMLANDKLQPVTVGLVTWQYMRGMPVGYSSVVTGALVSVIPVVILFLSLQRFWAKGLSAGAIK